LIYGNPEKLFKLCSQKTAAEFSGAAGGWAVDRAPDLLTKYQEAIDKLKGY
jgi:hypothetical protein